MRAHPLPVRPSLYLSIFRVFIIRWREYCVRARYFVQYAYTLAWVLFAKHENTLQIFCVEKSWICSKQHIHPYTHTHFCFVTLTLIQHIAAEKESVTNRGTQTTRQNNQTMFRVFLWKSNRTNGTDGVLAGCFSHCFALFCLAVVLSCLWFEM